MATKKEIDQINQSFESMRVLAVDVARMADSLGRSGTDVQKRVNALVEELRVAIRDVVSRTDCVAAREDMIARHRKASQVQS